MKLMLSLLATLAPAFAHAFTCSDGTHSITLTESTFTEEISASGHYLAQTDSGSARWQGADLVEITIFTRAFYDQKPARLAYPIVKTLRLAPDRQSVSFEEGETIQCLAHSSSL